MLWLPIAVACYFLFAVVFLIDKYLLAARAVNPKLLVFFTGAAGIFGFFLIPFGLIKYSGAAILALALAAGFFRIFATYLYFSALRACEVSRITASIGAVQPIISFWLICFFSGGKAVFDPWGMGAFAALILGSVIIAADKGFLTLATIRFSMASSFLFSLSFVLSKMVYDDPSQTFISAFFLMGFGSFAASAFFLAFGDVRRAFLNMTKSAKARSKSLKSALVFFINQIIGAGAFIMQNYAIALAPLAFVPAINAMAGVQYAFLFIFTVILSVYFPRIIKEKTTPAVIVQKIIAIILILCGLAIFGLK